jgi:hypothetical protein
MRGGLGDAHPPLPIVKDSAGQKLAFVYYEEEPGRRFPPGVAF